MELDYLKNINVKNLTRQELGGDRSFESAVGEMERIKNYLIDAWTANQFLSINEKRILEKLSEKFTDQIELIQNFQHLGAEPLIEVRQKRDRIIDSLREILTDFNIKILPTVLHFKFTNLSETQVGTAIKKANEKISQFDSDFKNIARGYETTFVSLVSDLQEKARIASTKIREIDDLLIASKKTKELVDKFSVGELTAVYGRIFLNQAEENRNSARIGLAVFVLVSFGMIGLAFFFFDSILEKLLTITNTQQSVEYIIAYILLRLFVLGVLFVFAKEGLKNFNINMHLFNLNMHRQNSLQSFNILIRNADMKETKEEIIKEIAQTIYSNQEDGYLPRESKKITFGEIVELIKAAKP